MNALALGTHPLQSRRTEGWRFPISHWTNGEERMDEWKLGRERPTVSGWQWIDFWTVGGIPGCARFGAGMDEWFDESIACWRYRGSMPPYAAAPIPRI